MSDKATLFFSFAICLSLIFSFWYDSRKSNATKVFISSLDFNEAMEKMNSFKKESTAKEEEKVPVTSVISPVDIKEEQKIFYRLTSYYTGDNEKSTETTGSGIKTSQFSINSKGWYTYNSYLVLAGATTACLNAKVTDPCSKYSYDVGKKYFHYYQIISIIIDGIEYKGIILDSCGACMIKGENRLDLFVSNRSYLIDRGYKGNNSIIVKF